MARRLNPIIVILSSAVLLGGCSYQSIYRGIKISGEQACQHEPESTRAQCLDSFSMSFGEYTRLRQELLDQDFLAQKLFAKKFSKQALLED